MRLRLSPHVPGDLAEIADFIANDSPRQALRVLLFRIRQNAVRIERVVHGGRDLLPLFEGLESHDRANN